MGVDIGPRVLRFSSLQILSKLIDIRSEANCANLQQDIRYNVINLPDELEHLVVRQMLQGEFSLSRVPRVRLPEYGMTIAGHNLAALERRPDVFFDSFVRCVLPDFTLHLAKPAQDFLVGEPMERTGKAIKGGSKGKEGIREGRANKFASVSRDVATFVVTEREYSVHYSINRAQRNVPVNGDVQSQKFNETLVVAKAEERSEIVGVVHLGVNSRQLASAKYIAVDTSGNVGEFRNSTQINNFFLVSDNKTPTGPWNLRRSVPNILSLTHHFDTPWQMRNRGLTVNGPS